MKLVFTALTGLIFGIGIAISGMIDPAKVINFFDLAGSWDPLGPTPDKWAPFGGRLYVTTMNLLSLEVAYRHLPLYGGIGEQESPASER